VQHQGVTIESVGESPAVARRSDGGVPSPRLPGAVWFVESIIHEPSSDTTD
jgi:hypothetical protein